MKYSKVYMMIDIEIKNKVLKQIDEFVNYQNSNKEPKRYVLNFYVPTDIAKDRAEFFGYIHNLKHFNCAKVIDLTFGSANLTSHLLLDNDIEVDTLILNDKNIDDANFSTELREITNDITDNDILDSDLFNDTEKYNVIVFNPQFGGDSYPMGDLGVKRLKDEEFIFYKYGEDLEAAFGERLDLSDCTISIDDDLKKIFVHSDTLRVGEMKKRFDKTKIFNYYDVFYQSKTNLVKGEASNLIKFRKTLEKIIYGDTMVVFLGKRTDYKLFFSDFNEYDAYIAETKSAEIERSIFIGKRSTTYKPVCYVRDGNDFTEFNCEKKNTYQVEDIVIADILKDIHSDLIDLKSLDGGELFVIDEKTGISAETLIPTPQNSNKGKPFKNFLLGFMNKENK